MIGGLLFPYIAVFHQITHGWRLKYYGLPQRARLMIFNAAGVLFGGFLFTSKFTDEQFQD